MDDHFHLVTDYTFSMQGVLYAGKQLRALINADLARQQYAVGQLTRAVEQFDGGGTTFRNFMFSESASIKGAATEKRARISEDVLATALADIEVANVLIASGRVLGEDGTKADPRELDRTLLRLENSFHLLREPLATSLDASPTRNRFGFATESTFESIAPPASPEESVERFRAGVGQTIDGLISESSQVLLNVFQSVKKLDASKVLEAFDNLGRAIPTLGKLVGLINWGLKKLYSALDVLIKLVGEDALNQIKAKIKEMWEKVSNGEYVQPVLEWAYGKVDTLDYVKQVLSTAKLASTGKSELLDAATLELESLGGSFKENMVFAAAIGSGISVAASLLAFTSLAGPNLALVTGCAFVTLMGVVVLLGMDYADSEQILRQVRGVRGIADSL